jgi:TetR/AcrR family tetracycline transcriptional repressor
VKLTEDRIIDAGMATFAEVGYHGLSMRQVAERLDAQAGSLYYHVKNKGVLLQLMADRVARAAYEEGEAAVTGLPPDASWVDRVEAQLVALRRAIARHPGGAVLLADSPKLLSKGALSLMERLLRTLAEAGVPAAERHLAADVLLSHVTGFVLQEQSESVTPPVTAEEYTTLRTTFPQTFTAPQLPEDEKFTRSVRLICAGIPV